MSVVTLVTASRHQPQSLSVATLYSVSWSGLFDFCRLGDTSLNRQISAGRNLKWRYLQEIQYWFRQVSTSLSQFLSVFATPAEITTLLLYSDYWGFVTKSGCCLSPLLAIGKLGLSGGISLLVMAQFRSYSWHNPNKMLSSPQLCPSQHKLGICCTSFHTKNGHNSWEKKYLKHIDTFKS